MSCVVVIKNFVSQSSSFSSNFLIHYFCLFSLIQSTITTTKTSTELPDTKMHTLLLDHNDIKLTWYIDWPNREILFNVDNAFTDLTKWFSFGFSKRGELEASDVCFFVNHYDENEDQDEFSGGIDTYIGADNQIYKDHQQDCVVLRMDDHSVAFKRKFDTCDPQDFSMHEGTMYLLWSRGDEMLEFPMPYARDNGTERRKRQVHGHFYSSENEGIVMAQLLRADKLDIPEK